MKKPSLEEISLAKSSLAYKWNLDSYNPDDLVSKKGLGIYDKMREDATCKSALTIKKLARLSSSWDIVPASEDNEDVKRADFIRYCFTDGLSGTFQDNLKQIYSALDYGYSVTEEVWKYIETGEWKGKYGLKYLKTRKPHDFTFITDEYGNLKELQQSVNVAEPISLDPSRFIIYVYQKEFDNWYGKSDLRSAYKHWLSKDWITKFQNIALERFGMGVMTGKYPRHLTNERSKIQDILDAIQAKTAIVVPEDIQLELMEMQGRGMDAFSMAIDKHNTAIMRSVLVPDLLGFTEMGVGSYALGKKHFDVFLWILEELGRDTEETIVGEQIIKRLIDFNFLNVTKYPKFKFAPLTEENKFEIAKTWISAVQYGTVHTDFNDENYLRALLGFPQKEEEAPIKETYRRKYAKHNKYTQKVNYKRIENSWDTLEENGVKELSGIVKDMRDKLLETIERRQIIENKDPKEVERLQLSYVGDFRDMIYYIMGSGYLISKNEALQELKSIGLKYAKENVFDKPLPPKEALKYFDELPVETKKQLDFFKQKSFTIAGIESKEILEKAKLIIYNGIKNGTVQQTKKQLNELFMKYLPTIDAETGKIISEYRLETIVRTNFADAINQGRKDMFEDADVKDNILAYMPSAVLDPSTTDFCESIDGNLYDKDTFIFPPYHYNCRTIAVPVTKWEVSGEAIENLEDFPANEMPGF